MQIDEPAHPIGRRAEVGDKREPETPEPSLLDVLKRAFGRKRVYRGAALLAGVYLICTGILGLADDSGAGLGAAVRFLLGAAILAAARSGRASRDPRQANQPGERATNPPGTREIDLRSVVSRVVAWVRPNILVAAYLLVLAGTWFLRAPAGIAGAGLLLAAAGLVLFWGAIRREGIASHSPVQRLTGGQSPETDIHWRAAAGGLALSILAFFSVREDRLTLASTALWITSVVAWMAAFRERSDRFRLDVRSAFLRLWRGEVELRLTRWPLLFLGILAVAAVFRFASLNTVPGEMTSDHVEDLFSVSRILNGGERPIFEPANGGREPLAFYVAALMAHFTGTGLTFFTLQLVSATAGFLALPFVYLLTREVTDDNLSGLLAMFAAGVAWWPNVLGRLGLPLSLTALFSALALWEIFRAIRRSRRNAALLSGLFAGIGMYASTPAWIVPMATTLALVVAGIHSRRPKTLRRLVSYWAMCTVITLATLVPMIRYRLDHLGDLWSGIEARVAGDYGQISQPTVRSFLRNEWNSIRMFHWTSDGAWIVSPSGQPALDWITAGLLTLGAFFLLYRYLRDRHWMHLYLLLAVPVLLLPSTLALAFDGRENPSLQRSSAAIPVLFAVTGIASSLVVEPFRRSPTQRAGQALAGAFMATVLGISAMTNWRIVFRDYAANYASMAQNASGIGDVIRSYATSIGSFETAFVKGYPNWVDVRAVGIYAGNFGWEQAICDNCRFRDALVVREDTRSKLFILHPMDQAFLAQLREVYPNGGIRAAGANVSHHAFLIYFVPGRFDSPAHRKPSP